MTILLTGNIAPGGSFYILEDIYLKGGMQTVADNTARDAILTDSRKAGMLVWSEAAGTLYRLGAGLTNGDWVALGFGGDVVGPAGATDNAVARFDGATGKLIKNSVLTVDDAGNIAINGAPLTLGASTAGDSTTITTAINGAGAAGDVVLAPGASTAGAGGGVSATGGNGTTAGGPITLTGGDASAGNGGSVTQTGGTGSVDGGNIVLVGGTGTTGDGGDITLTPGSGGTNQGVINITPPPGGTAPELRLFEDAANGTDYVAIKAPASVTPTPWTLTLPPDDGLAGQFLQTDGSGVTSWAAAAGGGVTGPGSSTNTAIAIWNGTGGTALSDSTILVGATTITQNTAGGALSLISGSGTAGGAIALQTGTSSDGVGGAVTLTAGAGVGTNRAGGTLTFNAGVATGTATAGGATFNLGTASASGTAGVFSVAGSTGLIGSDITLTAGNTNAAGGTRGGGITLQAGSAVGASGTRIGGIIALTGGAGAGTGAGGAINLTSGTAATGSGTIQIKTAVASAGTAGVINIEAGTGATKGGSVTITAGAGNASSGDGGNISLTAGSGFSPSTGLSAPGGGVGIVGGTGYGTGGGGFLSFFAGSIGGGTGSGGRVSIAGGSTSGTGGGGDVNIQGGASANTSGGSTAGNIQLWAGAGSNAATQAGHIDFSAGRNATTPANNGRIRFLRNGAGIGLPAIVDFHGSNGVAVSLTVSGSVTAYTIDLPTAQGAANTYLKHNGSGVYAWATAGDVFGPASSDTNAIATYSNTTGKLLQNTALQIVSTAILPVSAGDSIVVQGASNAPGTGGSASLLGGTGATPGEVLVQAGARNSPGTGATTSVIGGVPDTTSKGGATLVQGGPGGTMSGNGGDVTINGGDAVVGTGGAATLRGGNSTSGNSGSLTLASGTALGTTGDGGDVAITASAGGSFSGDGGSITLVAGNSDNTPGFVTINAGVSLSGAFSGGAIALNAGGSDSGTGGAVSLTAGNSTNAGGGAASVTAGNGDTSGGNLLLTAGDGLATGGDIQLRPGGSGAATSGEVIVTPIETAQHAIIRAGTSSRDLFVGGAPASSAATGARIVSRTPTAVTAADNPVALVSGSINRVDISGGGSLTLNLPDPATCAGQWTWIIKVDASTNDFTVATPAGNILFTSSSVTSFSVNGGSLAERRMFALFSDGSNYYSLLPNPIP